MFKLKISPKHNEIEFKIYKMVLVFYFLSTAYCLPPVYFITQTLRLKVGFYYVLTCVLTRQQFVSDREKPVAWFGTGRVTLLREGSVTKINYRVSMLMSRPGNTSSLPGNASTLVGRSFVLTEGEAYFGASIPYV